MDDIAHAFEKIHDHRDALAASSSAPAATEAR
jgi:hypothetical protein